jgi:hypothetical protein
MKINKLLIRAGLVLLLAVVSRVPADAEPTDSEPWCTGTIIGYEDTGNTHCCLRSNCSWSSEVNFAERKFFYSEPEGCVHYNAHFASVGCC